MPWILDCVLPLSLRLVSPPACLAVCDTPALQHACCTHLCDTNLLHLGSNVMFFLDFGWVPYFSVYSIYFWYLTQIHWLYPLKPFLVETEVKQLLAGWQHGTSWSSAYTVALWVWCPRSSGWPGEANRQWAEQNRCARVENSTELSCTIHTSQSHQVPKLCRSHWRRELHKQQ